MQAYARLFGKKFVREGGQQGISTARNYGGELFLRLKGEREQKMENIQHSTFNMERPIRRRAERYGGQASKGDGSRVRSPHQGN
jgi:hypothetical protein